jgi:phosphoserine phosphatase RsbU/P
MSNAYSVMSAFVNDLGLDYHGERQLAEDVGGDFFDFVPIGNQALVASVGDVSGTSISAAILKSGVQSLLRSLTTDGRGNISTIVQELNRAVYGISPDVFFPTLFYTRIDPLLRRLEYVSAGHETAFLVRKDARRLLRLERTGTVLGLTNHTVYRHRTLTIEPGDVLIAFTDRIAEGVDACGYKCYEASILDAVRRHPGAGASVIVGLLVEAVARFTGESTVIAVRYTGEAAKAWLEASIEETMFAAA